MLAAQDTNTLPIIIKADVQGSLESVIQSLESIQSEEVSVDIVSSGVGPVNETDVTRAKTSNALVLGFSVPIPVAIKRLALREQVSIKLYTVIYELIDEVKALLSKMLPPEIVETDIGRLKIKGIFRTTKNEIICGGLVTKGKVQPNALVRISRDKAELAEVTVTSVKREESEAKEVFEGELCGLQLKTNKKILLKEGDVLDLFTREEIQRKLD